MSSGPHALPRGETTADHLAKIARWPALAVSAHLRNSHRVAMTDAQAALTPRDGLLPQHEEAHPEEG
jgi:hypothetical protein